VAYQARWPLGLALSFVVFEGLACSAGGSAPGGQYGGASGAGATGDGGAGATSGTGQGATGGGNPGGTGPGGATGSGGAGNNTGTGGDSGSTGTGGDGGVSGDGGDGGVSGTDGFGGSGALPPFDGGTDPNRNNVQPGQVCERLATIQCAAEVSCCGSPGRTFDQCKTAQLNICRNEAYLDAISSNAIAGFDAGRAAAAFAEFERLASMCDPAIVEWAISPTGLRGIVNGTKNANESCYPGSMDKALAAAHLASCTNSAAQACLPLRLLAWECRPRGQVGAACFSDLNCVDGLYCDNPNLTINSDHKCTQRKLKDATCATSNECQSLFCRGGTCIAPSAGAAYCLAVR
jgi:hypothetical protein